MKKIALLTDGWKRLVTQDWVSGIVQRLKESDEKILLFQYNSFGSWSTDENHNYGEFNIYKLPKLETFDGVIVDATSIRKPRALEQVNRLLSLCPVPTVSIAVRIPGCTYIANDNAGAICGLIRHLYEEHGCRRFIYAGGPYDSEENLVRVQAYKDQLMEYGMNPDEHPVYLDDYSLSSGIRIFERLSEENQPLPDAFVCCNDNVAAGLIQCANKKGYRIPQDFLVTGFDYLDKAQLFQPSITSVEHQRVAIGYRCADLLIQKFRGKELPKEVYVPCQLHFQESCGCTLEKEINFREHLKQSILDKDQERDYSELLMEFEDRVGQLFTFREVLVEAARFYMHLPCHGIAFAIDQKLFELVGEEEFLDEGYDLSRMTVFQTFKKEATLTESSFSDFEKRLMDGASASAYLFSPMHFGRKMIGFVVLTDGGFLYDNPYFYNIQDVLTTRIVSLYRWLHIQKINEQLKQMYHHDQLTGVFNRFAFAERICSRFQQYSMDDNRYALIFSDVDHFKEINDTKGHVQGDQVLRTIAACLTRNCPGEGSVYRFGGDEFVAFFNCNDESRIGNFITQVKQDLKPDEIEISMGYIIIEAKDGRGYEQCILEADHEMYRVKNEGR